MPGTVARHFNRLEFLIRLSFREARRGSRELLMLFIAVAVGSTVLSSVGLLEDLLSRAVSTQASNLLGADAVLSSRRAITSEDRAVAEKIPGEKLREITFASMATGVSSGQSRLVQVNATEPGFPFYGKFETEPAAARQLFVEGEGALVDEAIYHQLALHQGELIAVGELELPVLGFIKTIPGDFSFRSMVAPRVYIPFSSLERSALLGLGSRARYTTYFKFPPELSEAYSLPPELKDAVSKQGLSFETAKSRAGTIEKVSTRVMIFLRLVALLALFLGVLGAASSAVVFANHKVVTVSLLRCLGLRERSCVFVFLLQAVIFSLAGAAFGVALGYAISDRLQATLDELFSLETGLISSFSPLFVATGVSFLTVIVCVLPPLLALRNVSPAAVLRLEDKSRGSIGGSSGRVWLLAFLILGGVSLIYTASPLVGGIFFLGVSVCLALLLFAGNYVLRLFRRLSTLKNLPLFLKHGLLCLSRPGNRSSLIISILGLAIMLLALPGILKTQVIQEIVAASGEGKPNIIIFDVQPEDLPGMSRWIADYGLDIIDKAPIVPMKLSKINRRDVSEIRAERNSESQSREDWALIREYRSTYRNKLSSGEEVVAGDFYNVPESTSLPTARGWESDPIPISLEERMLERLQVDLGDELAFDIQGRELKTRIVSVRKVDWLQLRPNFFVVFPEGVLERAPQTFVLTIRLQSAIARASFQRQLLASYPNVSVIDLSLVLETLDQVLLKAEEIVSLLTWASVLSALLVLLSLVWAARPERVRERTILKVLGAKRSMVLGITIVEFSLLGMIAGILGGALALFLGAALSWQFFDSISLPDIRVLLWTTTVATLLTLTVGLLGSLSLYSKSSRETLY